jgi:cytidylate kinase
VKLVASPEVRAQRMMKLLNCDAAAAAAHNRETDLARRRYVKARFEQDIDDPHHYDLVINTDRMSPAAVSRLIVEALHGRQTDLQAGARGEDRQISVPAGGI